MIVWFGTVTHMMGIVAPTTRALWGVVLDPLAVTAQNAVKGSWLETTLDASGQWVILMTEAAAATSRDAVGPIRVLRLCVTRGSTLTYARDLPSLLTTEGVGSLNSLPPLVGH